MAQIITMPRLSDTMTEGVVAQWLKKVGDKIEEGDILAEIETDKATMEFESFNEGFLLHIGLQEGETAPVDSLLAIIGEEGEDFSSLLTGDTAAPAKEIASPEATENEEALVTAAPTTETATIPENITVVTMPRLSDTMTDGTVATWLKKVGDVVAEGDILAEIETDKATMEFESFNEGTLLYIGLQEGETAPVDSLLAIIGESGTDVTDVVNSFTVETATPAPAETPKKDTPAATPAETPTAIATPSKPAASAPAQSAAKKVSAIQSENGRIIASPLAKALAQEKGINLAKVVGTGEGGRIIKTDVENFTDVIVADVPTVTVAAPIGEVSQSEVKNSQMRKAIVRALDNSQTTAVNFTIGMDINMDNAMASRKEINALPDTKVSFNDMVVKACAMALKKHPQINTEWTDDKTIYNNHISVGVAVAIEDGLVVPVIPFTDSKSLTEIGAEVKDKAIKAKNKKLTPAEMSGSTFTVSNLGMFGVTEFTSIINQPNSAILSVGGINQQPIVKDGQIVVGNIMKVTLACDHRTIDGAVGAAFLNTLKQYIENPVTMLA